MGGVSMARPDRSSKMVYALAGTFTGALTTVIGVVLGVFAAPVTAWILRRGELKIARTEIYSELAGYIAGMERVRDNKVDFESAKRHCTWRPQFDVMDWYKSNRFDLLLRLDRSRGLRIIYNSIPFLYEHANAPGNAPFGLPGSVLQVVSNYESKLDGKLLRKRISEAHAEYAATLARTA
jgi:hypothetical protein